MNPPSNTNPFVWRVLYAPTRELIDYAARLGMNWVVAATSGHKSVDRPIEDPPVYMPDYSKLRPVRESLRDRIEAHRQMLRERFARAKEHGLRVIYHTYELSVPKGFEEAYPEMFSPPLREFRGHPSPEGQQTNLCISRPDVQDAIAAKVRELCETFGEIDAFSYTNNESATRTQVWHRCDLCRDIPYALMMKSLHDAIQRGIDESGRDVRLIVRCWGTHDAPFKYWNGYRQRAEWGVDEIAGKQWLPAFVEATRPDNLHFQPDRDIPLFIDLMRGEKRTAFVYKASWADNNLHHPLNPWIGRHEGHEEICELSFEHAFYRPRVFYIMGREMQRRARLCRERGVEGLCGLSAGWGAQDSEQDRLHPSRCGLAELNVHLFAALAHDPAVDLEQTVAAYLRQRYGETLAQESALVEMLLDTEDVAAEAMNVRGIRSTENGERIPGNLASLLSSFVRYAPMYDDWQQRIDPNPENLQRIFAAKRRNLQRAETMLQHIASMKDQLPRRAFDDFHEAFEYLHTMARSFDATHRFFLTLWALRQGRAQPTTALLNDLIGMAKRYAEILPVNPSQG